MCESSRHSGDSSSLFLSALSAQFLGPRTTLWFCCHQIVDFIRDPSPKECSDLVQWARGDTVCLRVLLEDACGWWPCGLWPSDKGFPSHENSWGLERVCLQLLWFMVWKDW